MKKLKKLKLNTLSEMNLMEREMNRLKGGTVCSCSCYYEYSGGSSASSNGNANHTSGNGYTSIDGCNQYIVYTGGYFDCTACSEDFKLFG
jgi:natural product precursor